MAMVALAPPMVVHMNRPVVRLPEGLEYLRKGITKLENFVEGKHKTPFSSGDSIMLYTMVYNMCTQRAPHDYSEQLYEMFRGTIDVYTKTKVLPSLKKKHDEFMLDELVKRWSNYKQMVRSLSYFFGYLDRFFIPRKNLPSLLETGLTTFHQLIYEVIKGNIKDALVATIKKRHVSKQMDMTFLTNLLDVFHEISCNDSEDSSHKSTVMYCMEAQKWLKKSYEYYIIQDEEYLKSEKPGDQEIRYFLFTKQYPKQVLENELFELLRDAKLEVISSTYRFFESTGHLNELKDIFSKYLLDESGYLVQQAEDSSTNKEVLLWRFIGLHDIVMECFQKHTLFLKALEESVLRRCSAEFFGRICRNIWKKDQFGSLTNEGEKVYQDVKGKVTDKLIALIGEQHKHMEIDEGDKVMMALLRKVLDMLFHIKPDCYMEDIAYPLMNSIEGYYSKMASSFFGKNIGPEDYMKKVDECSALEMERAQLYSPFHINHMLFERVINVLIRTYSDALLRDDKGDERLSRLYTLYCSQICGFKEPILKSFQEGLKNEIESIVKQNGASNMKEIVRRLSGLYDKYKALATKSFQDDSCFNEAIKEAFRLYLNNGDLVTLLAKMYAHTLCDIIQKKVYDDKVLILLPYISDKDTFDGICRKELEGRLQEPFAYDENLSKAYRLFSQTIGGQQPFICMFKMDFVSELIWLHDKYEDGAKECFEDHASFHEAIREAFRFKLNDGDHTLVAGIIADALCDIILKKGCSEKLSAEGGKVHLDKVLILLSYFGHKDTFADICRKTLEGRLQKSAFLDLDDDRNENLCMMYTLFSETIGGPEPFVGMFKTHLRNEIMELVKKLADSASDKEGLALKIIELHDKYEAYVTKFFQGHKEFHKSLVEIFKVVFCNKDISSNLTTELLAIFCHDIIKKGYSEELEIALDKVVRLLTYMDHTELFDFANFYRWKLAIRLLSKQSTDNDHEKCMLSKLERQFGSPFTWKMNGMISDITGTSAKQIKYQNFKRSHPVLNPGIDFSVIVLNKHFWPSYKASYIKLPPEMKKCQLAFKEFYQSTTKHRKLSWIFSLGDCNINATFATKTIELIVTPNQAALLLLFNESDRLSCSEIAKKLNVSDDDVMPLLYSLSSDKHKILNKFSANGTDSLSYDYFEFNPEFTNEMGTIKMPLPADKNELVENVNVDRSYAIAASVMRIMKTHKVMHYKDLVPRCVQQLNRVFKPDERAIKKQIKKQIEDLIHREYIERDKNNADTFRYLP